MERELGRTDIKVRAIGFGAMPLSIDGRPSDEDAVKVILAAIEAGTNFIDTADAYCHDDSEFGHNERLIARALSQLPPAARRSVIVATKGGCTRPEGRWENNGSPKHIKSACEASLKNLGLETIPLYQLHAVDPSVPLEETLGAMAELKQSGKVLHLGLSNVKIDQIKAALTVTRIETVQNRANPAEQRDFKNGLVSFCADNGITCIHHSPVGGIFNHGETVKHPLFRELAERYEASPYRVILAWHLTKGPNIIPIPGGSKISSVTDSPRAVDLVLSAEDIERIDRFDSKH